MSMVHNDFFKAYNHLEYLKNNFKINNEDFDKCKSYLNLLENSKDFSFYSITDPYTIMKEKL